MLVANCDEGMRIFNPIKCCRGRFLGRGGSRGRDSPDLHLPSGISERFAVIVGFSLPLISQCSFNKRGEYDLYPSSLTSGHPASVCQSVSWPVLAFTPERTQDSDRSIPNFSYHAQYVTMLGGDRGQARSTFEWIITNTNL